MNGAPIAAAKPARYPIFDILRGIALLAMVGYHIGWDLFYLRVIKTDITADPVWIGAQLSILGSFVFLAGGSLVLAHRSGIRWRSFWRREAILIAAAAAVSLGTFIAFGPYFAFFGVLHAIALFSLLALPFVRAPLWLVAAVAAAVVAAPFVWTHPAFADPRLAWIGFWPQSPPTVDLVPILPWFGVMLGGVLAVRLLLASQARERLAAWQGGALGRALATMGRWSLIIYLVHQPLLYGGLSALVGLLPQPAPLTPAAEFAQNCRPSCTSTGAPEGYCTAYCACALDAIEAGDLWDAIGAENQTPDQARQTEGVINICRAMAEGE